MSYYLAERAVKRLFIDLMFKPVMKTGNIEDRRILVVEHLCNYAKPTMVKNIIDLGKAAAKNVPLFELDQMAKKVRE